MGGSGRLPTFTRTAWQRLREAWWPVALASLAAALSWFFAHRVLGHPQPFFAPIAAERDALTASILRAAADDLAKVVDGDAGRTTTPHNRGAWQS